jgi:hypothetical protein
VFVGRLALFGITVVALVACVDQASGDTVNLTSWRLTREVTPDATLVSINVFVGGCPDDATVRANVVYGYAEIMIATTIERRQECTSMWPYGVETPYLVRLTEPVGNRQLIDPTDLLSTYPPPTPTPNPPTDDQ